MIFRRLRHWWRTWRGQCPGECEGCELVQAARPRWLDAGHSPFGCEVLDCRPFALHVMATTANAEIAESFLRLRRSFGEELRGKVPENARTIPCRLEYRYSGEVSDGAVCKAASMEEKWDVYLYDACLYFARSWTGELTFRAGVEFAGGVAAVAAIETGSADPDTFVIRQVDFLIKSHLFNSEAPHPLPAALGRDPQELAIYSFSQYGRRGLFGVQ